MPLAKHPKGARKVVNQPTLKNGKALTPTTLRIFPPQDLYQTGKKQEGLTRLLESSCNDGFPPQE